MKKEFTVALFELPDDFDVENIQIQAFHHESKGYLPIIQVEPDKINLPMYYPFLFKVVINGQSSQLKVAPVEQVFLTPQ